MPRSNSALAYLIALALVAAALGVRIAVPFFHGYPYATFILAVLLSAAVGGLGPGIAVTVLGGAAAWYFLVPPERSFALNTPSDHIGLALYFIETLLICVVVVASQRARDAARSAQEQRELLLAEVRHRVANNLQTVASLIRLQMDQVGEPRARRALAETAGRIRALGLIHRNLYRLDRDTIDIKGYLTEICAETVAAVAPRRIQSAVAIAAVELDAERAIALGLIVHELVSNAATHGFAPEDQGAIRVALERREDGGLALVVTDNGHGLPAGFDLARAGSVGLRVVQALTRQLSGSFTLHQEGRGVAAELTFPLPPQPAPAAPGALARMGLSPPA